MSSATDLDGSEPIVDHELLYRRIPVSFIKVTTTPGWSLSRGRLPSSPDHVSTDVAGPMSEQMWSISVRGSDGIRNSVWQGDDIPAVSGG